MMIWEPVKHCGYVLFFSSLLVTIMVHNLYTSIYVRSVLVFAVRSGWVSTSPSGRTDGNIRHRKTSATVILFPLSTENPQLGRLRLTDVSRSGVLASSWKLHEDVEVFPRWERLAKLPIAAFHASTLISMTCNESNNNKGVVNIDMVDQTYLSKGRP